MRGADESIESLDDDVESFRSKIQIGGVRMVDGMVTHETDLLVIGGGPGGYVAACAAADEGISTTLVEKADVPGGVCLREGCIPSKALLHVAKIMHEAKHAKSFGLTFAPPEIDLNKLRAWKKGVIRRLSLGVKGLLSGRDVKIIKGIARFDGPRVVSVEAEEPMQITFRRCIVATGSVPSMLPEKILPRELCWDAAGALQIEEIPERLLVIGGGYIGVELSQVYATFGSEVTVVEALPDIMAGADPDLTKPLKARLRKQFKAIHTSAMFQHAAREGDAIAATYCVEGQERTESFDRILVSVGRRPNTAELGLENTELRLDDQDFIIVDRQLRTSDEQMFAIGDVVGNPMLAHKAMREARVAVEVMSGKDSVFEPACIPAVVYADPEVAWCGITEPEAIEQGLDVCVTSFPWTASGRAVAMSRTDGLTKMIFDKVTRRVLGVGVVGAHAGDLIGEAVLAMEMGAKADDISRSIHPHPATSETLAEAAEAAFGKAIHGSH